MKIIMKKDIVAGLGEIGLPILKILSKKEKIVGYDIDKKLMNEKKFLQLNELPTSLLHIAIPVTSKFDFDVIQLYKKFKPDCIVIHSTIPPGTTERLQKKLSSPIIYSATRGVHKRMLRDLKRYTKFFAIPNSAPKKQWAAKTFSKKIIDESFSNLEITSKPIKESVITFAERADSLGYLGRSGYNLDGIFYNENTLQNSMGMEKNG